MTKRRFDFTSTMKTSIIKAVSGGVTPRIAAAQVGINQTTLEEIRDQYPEFDEQLEEATNFVIGEIEKALFTNAVGKLNVAAQKFFLERNYPQKYMRKMAEAVEENQQSLESKINQEEETESQLTLVESK